MNFEREVEYRMAKWIFANLYHLGEVDQEIYHRLLNGLLDSCDPPMKSIEERFDVSEGKEDKQGREFTGIAAHGADKDEN